MNAPADAYLLLTRQTFVALTDDTLVFLELHNDNYSCLERRHTKPVARLLGLPIPDGDGYAAGTATNRESEDVLTVIDDLIDRGNVIYDDFIQNTCQNQPIMAV